MTSDEWSVDFTHDPTPLQHAAGTGVDAVTGQAIVLAPPAGRVAVRSIQTIAPIALGLAVPAGG